MNMQTAEIDQYGGPEVVTLRQRPVPQPRPGQLLVKTLATTVSAADWRIRSCDVPYGFGVMIRLFFGWRRPRQPILGTEMVAEVVAAGDPDPRFAIGSRLVIYAGAQLGCHSEYRLLDPATPAIPVPAGLNNQEAAALCFGGMTALDLLYNKAALQAGENLLVIGAGGAVGSAAVQLGRYRGARVTAVCSAAKQATVVALGAERVIDYAQQDALAEADRYDLILDTVGAADSSALQRALRPGGRALLVVADLPATLLAPLRSCWSSRRLIAGTAGERQQDLETLAQIVEAGGFRPLIDSVWPFSRIREATQKVDDGHKTGSVVLVPDALWPG